MTISTPQLLVWPCFRSDSYLCISAPPWQYCNFNCSHTLLESLIHNCLSTSKDLTSMGSGGLTKFTIHMQPLQRKQFNCRPGRGTLVSSRYGTHCDMYRERVNHRSSYSLRSLTPKAQWCGPWSTPHAIHDTIVSKRKWRFIILKTSHNSLSTL